MCNVSSTATRWLVPAFFAVFLAVGQSACSIYVKKPFNLMDEKQPLHVASVAVIAGDSADAPKKLAELVTRGLQERTSMRVLSQEEIGRLVANYPFPIKLKGNLERQSQEEKMIWFDPAEQAKLNALQARLKVDGLLVLWVPWMRVITPQSYGNPRNQGSMQYSVWTAGNMIEYPGSRVAASSRMYRNVGDSLMKVFRSKDYYIVKALEESANDIVDEFLIVNPMLKK